MPLFLPRPTLADLGGQSLDSDLTDIATLATTPFGRAFLTLADSSGITVQQSTWTPAYVMTTSGSVTASTAEGRWWAIGKLRVVTGFLVASGVISPVGSVRSSLPFAVLTTTIPAAVRGAAWAETVTNLSAEAHEGGSLLVLRKNSPGAASSLVNAADLATNAGSNQIRFCVIYEVA
jgi:hypothetical protein